MPPLTELTSEEDRNSTNILLLVEQGIPLLLGAGAILR
jgi:hypothetical protein